MISFLLTAHARNTTPAILEGEAGQVRAVWAVRSGPGGQDLDVDLDLDLDLDLDFLIRDPKLSPDLRCQIHKIFAEFYKQAMRRCSQAAAAFRYIFFDMKLMVFFPPHRERFSYSNKK